MADKHTLHVAVCIVGFGNAADVAQCLEGLARSTHRDFEVVICENGGDPAHQALKAALPATLPGGQRVTLLNAPDNPGYAGGVNRCLAAAPDADAWWVLNPDTMPDAEALGALVRRLARGDADAVGGQLLLGDGRVQNLGGGRWRAWLARAESIEAGTEAPVVEQAMSYVSGASMLIGRRFRDRVGPMREDYFLYCEEVDWCLRGRRLGLRLGYAPDARVRHLEGSTTGSGGRVADRSRLSIYLDERNKLHLIRDFTPARLPVAALSSLALMTLRYARRGAFRQWGYALSGWLAALRNERGKPAWLAPR